jgi:heme exporter protein B
VNLAAHVLALLGKDLLAEWRTKERLSPMVFFVLLILLVFNFSFELGGAALIEIGPGVLWSAFVFASLLGLQRTFTAEHDNGCLDALLAAPVSRTGLYVAKALANLLYLLAVEVVTLPLFALFFNLDLGRHLLPLPLVLVLGSVCLASVGTLFAAMSGHSRLREFLLPLLLLPIIMPALISCVEATAAILEQGLPRAAATLWPAALVAHLQMLAVYATIFTTVSLLLFEHIIEE